MRTSEDLRNFQHKGIKFLCEHPRAAIFGTMGVGKTAITLHHIALMHKRVLIITTKRVAELVWASEAKEWVDTMDLTFSIVTGSKQERVKALMTPADVTLVNIENTKWLMEHIVPEHYDTLILDELSLWKGGRIRWKALRHFAASIDSVIGLTGTPNPNGHLDLWPQMELIQPRMLGRTKTMYKQQHFYALDPNGWNWALRPGAEQEILKAMQPYVMRISNDELEMPELVFNHVPVDIPHKAACLMRDFKREGLINIGGSELVAESAAVLQGKLHQMSNGRVYDSEGDVIEIHPNKAHACAELVNELQGEPVLIAYHYQHDQTALLEIFPDAEVLGSGIDEFTATRIVKAWNAGEIPVLLIHPAAAGHGLNLQKGGRNIIWYGLTWNLDHFEQTIARIYRQGQTSGTVFVHMLLAGELDNVVANALTNKANVQQAVLDYFEGANHA